ncbi:MAG: DUF3592 domain-containing protein [Luteolibacter sp.]
MKTASLFLVIFGFAVAVIGGFFTWLMWDSYQRASAMHNWPQTEGMVLSSEVNERKHDEFSPMEYNLGILYGYEWEGEARTSDRFSARGDFFSKDRSRAEGLVKKYPVGAKVPVYVSPGDAEYSVLKPDTKAAGYSIWFPLLFVVGGLGIVVRAVIPGRR